MKLVEKTLRDQQAHDILTGIDRLRIGIEEIKDQMHALPQAEGASFDSFANQDDIRFLEGTRHEILQEVHDWATDPDSKCIFWLNGAAGTGKSTITRTAAASFAKKRWLGASFFIKRGQPDRGDDSKFIYTIAFNLTVLLRGMIRTVQDNLSEDHSIPSKAMGIQFNRLILETLLSVQLGGEVERLIVVIDALDECGDGKHMPAMLKFLVQAKQAGNVQLQFFITSRPDFHPNEGFFGNRG